MSHARFQKQLREKARREKAAAKVQRREDRKAEVADAEPTEGVADQATLVAELADLHRRYDAGEVEFDEFLDAKAELTERLQIT